MRGVYVSVLVVAASLIGGCTGVAHRNDLARLQSQVGLLDERVTQLERANGMSGSLSAAPSSELSAMQAAATAPAGNGTPAKEAPAATPAPSLKPSTREIQQALKNAGFYQGAIDGKMGPATREAVKEFQRVHGLTDDGVVGRQTWATLRAFVDLSPKDGEAHAAEVLK